MVEFTVKEIAFQLDSTTQNIYKKLDKLISKGMAYKDSKGHPFVYDTGLEYLKQEKISRQKVVKLKNANTSKSTDNNDKNELQNENETVAKLYKKLYEELKIERDFWKNKFEEKDRAYNEVTSQLLLSSGNQNAVAKKNLFARIFGK